VEILGFKIGKSEKESQIEKAQAAPVDATLSGFDLRIGFDDFKTKYQKNLVQECRDEKITDGMQSVALTGKTCFLSEGTEFIGKAFFYNGKLDRFTRSLVAKKITVKQAVSLISGKSGFPMSLIPKTKELMDGDPSFDFENKVEQSVRFRLPGSEFFFQTGGCVVFKPLSTGTPSNPKAVEALFIVGEPTSPAGVPCSNDTLDDQIALKVFYINREVEDSMMNDLQGKKLEKAKDSGFKL